MRNNTVYSCDDLVGRPHKGDALDLSYKYSVWLNDDLVLMLPQGYKIISSD